MNPPELKHNQYQCAACHQVFEKGWSDEEAKNELSGNFGDISTDDCAIVCDDCYNEMMGIDGNKAHT